MPGSNYLGSAYSTLSQLLGTPVAGPYSAGFDALSGQYTGAEESGVSDITRRGLTQSGAVPELYTNLGEQYARGAGSIISSGQQQQNQQTLQLLNSLLGLGSTAGGVAQTQLGGALTDIGAGGEIATGLFGDVPTTLFGRGGGGLLSTGIYGGPQALFSKLLGP